MNNISKSIINVIQSALVPFIVSCLFGVLGWMISYFIGMADCNFYGKNKLLSSKFSFWECYVKAEDSRWYTKQEYQSSKIGTKLIIEKEYGEVLTK